MMHKALTCFCSALILFLSISGCTTKIPEPKEPIVFAKHGAWTWFNDERAIFANGSLFIGYVDTAGYSTVTIYSPDKEQDPQTFRLGTLKEIDDHNNPAFVQLENGSVLATYALHHTEPYWYWRFGETDDSGNVSWSEEYKSDDMGARITYNNLFRLDDENGKIYNFFRGTNFDPSFMVSEDEGQSWSSIQHFISSGGQWTRPYVKYASNGTNRIDIFFTQAHPRDAETNIYHAFYQNGTIRKSDGTVIQALPGKEIPPVPVNTGTLIYDASTKGRAWVWDLEYTEDNDPVAVFVTATDSTTGNDLRYHYARWDNASNSWTENEIAFAGTHLYDGENHYAGGITIDPSDPNIIYTSSDVHPVTGDTTSHYQIYKAISNDKGANWKWTSLTPNATEDNIRPFVTRGGKEHRAVLWLRGRYTKYTDFDLDIVGFLN